MKKDEIKVPRKYLRAAIITLVILTGLILSWNEFSPSGTEQAQVTAHDTSLPAAGSAEKFALLSGEEGQRSVGST